MQVGIKKLKRFFDVYVPIENCNLRCDFCYITQRRLFKNKKVSFKYSAQHIGKALSQERLGGICHFNLCGGGETLIPKEIVGIIRAILEQGHFIMVVTNGTMFNRFDEFIEFPAELKDRVGFKLSFHYLEFKRLDIMQKWFDNVNRVRNAGMSISVEITPTDELIPHIDDIKKVCLENVGALCHVTVARDNTKPYELPIMTKLSREEYEKTWGDDFDTPMNHFKMQTFNVKRNEFCYAGAWSGYINIGSGSMTQCYASYYSQNIFEKIEKPIEFLPVGHNCSVPHCYNSHAFLTLGLIPEMVTPSYSQIRDREIQDTKFAYTHWLTDSMRKFLSGRLVNENVLLSEEEKRNANKKNRKLKIRNIFRRIFRKKI
ncbi:MAG: radical SAM protein [Treponema sp.]|jgi:organic radical activating enzyme|nr:radical SAM protein [Treponema sp.]